MYSKTIQRRSVGALFFLLGIVFSTWASQIPHIQAILQLSDVELGFTLFAIPLGRFATVPFAGKLIGTYGSRKLSILSILFNSLVLVTLGLAPTREVLLVFLFFFGMSYNIIIVSINTQAVLVGKHYERSIMASFHGLWSLACFIGAIYAGFLIKHGVNTLMHFIITSALSITNVLICLRYLPEEMGDKQQKKPFLVMPDRYLLLLGLISFCCLLCEGTMYDWSGVYFSKIVKPDKELIGIGYSAVMGAMAFGRFVSDWYVTKFGLHRTFQLSGALITIGLIIVITFPYLVPAAIGFGMVGLGVSSVVPLAYAAAGKSDYVEPAIAIVTVSTVGFFGYLIGPPTIGMITEASSLRVAFAIVGLMGLGIAFIGSKVNVKK